MQLRLLSHYGTPDVTSRFAHDPAMSAGFAEICQRMRQLLDRLAHTPPDLLIWAHTSLLNLTLTDQDASTDGVSIVDHGGWSVKYFLPPAKAPWPHAFLGGWTDDVDVAARMVLTALQRRFPTLPWPA